MTRFDIVEAWYLFAREMGDAGILDRIRLMSVQFSPAIVASQWPHPALTENGRLIYQNLIVDG